MTQRNPMNDRYQTDEKKGQTRKSASQAKPKAKAASTVRIQSSTKTPQQKKAVKKTQRQQQSQVDRKYYNPPTAEYKRLRKLWWVLLISAIAMTGLSWFSRSWFPNNDMIGYVTLGAAYILIIGALFVDFSKIRKVRRAYQEEMEASKTKEQRAEEKKAKAAAEAKAKEQGAAAPTTDAPKKRGLFGTGFRLTGATPAKDATATESSDDAAKSSSKVEEAATSKGARGILNRAKKTVDQADAAADGSADQEKK